MAPIAPMTTAVTTRDRVTELRRLLNPKRAEALGVFALPALAVVLRLAYAATLSRDIVITFEADPVTYDQIARNLVAGRGFSGASFYYPPGSDVPTAFWDPLYPVLLAAIYLVAGHSVPLVRVAQAFLGGIAVWLIFKIGKRLASQDVGLIAAAVTTAYPFFIYYTGQLLTETLFITVILGAFACSLKAEATGSARWFATVGGLAGLSALCRAEAFPFGIALIAWTAYRAAGPLGPPIGQALRLAALALICMGIVMAPWAVRNQLTFGVPIFTTTKLGYNLFKYYHPLMTADQTVRAVPFPDLDDLTEPQREAVLRAEGLRFMTADPARTAWFMLNKLGLLFKLTPSNEVNQRYALLSVASFGLLLPFMVSGAMLALRRGTRFASLVAYVLFGIATKAAVFAGIRLRMQIEPVLILFAALALSKLLQRVTRPQPGR